MADDLSIVSGGQSIAGWTDVSVTLRAEGFPNSFEISATSRAPDGKSATIVKPGDACQVMLGADTVITGYVDRVVEGGDKDSHTLSLSGRGMTQDLVDCSAIWTHGQMVSGTALDIAKRLASAYGTSGIKVKLGPGASAGDPIPSPTFLNYTETGADIIQRVALNAKLLAYEDATGALVLATVGSTQAASGAVYGQNVQAWSAENSMDQRFSDLICCSETMDGLADFNGSDFYYTATDPGVPRMRNRNVQLEHVAVEGGPAEFTKNKAIWEVARRLGRSTTVHVTLDSWRDSAGTLWAPNTLMPVDVPGLLLANKILCISEVTFRRNNETGTTADLLLMPPQAFTPEPISLLPLDAPDLTEPT
jgi:prophage tail gpP-like protein